VISPDVSADRRATFRILAAKAEAVRLNGGDIPGNGRGAEMTKDTNGVWEVTLGPIGPGAYRYHFNVGWSGGNRPAQSGDERIEQ